MQPTKRSAKLTAFGIIASALLLTSSTEGAVGKAVVRSVRGAAEFSDQGGVWNNLAIGRVLAPTSNIKTAAGSQLDLFLGENGPEVRLMENTMLALEKMNFNAVGPGVFVFETSLDLKTGVISGNTQMMIGHSQYEVKTPVTSCLIRAAEYKISADGTHQVTRGSAAITYKNSQGVVTTKTITAGETFVLPTDKLADAFRMLREAVDHGEIPGYIALVAREGQILRHEAYGLREIDEKLPFATNTLCWIASITKPVTVTAAMTLVDAGKLALDDPVEKHLPEFRDQLDTNGTHHVFTIRHLMSHMSGLVPNPPTRRSAWPIGGPLDDSWLEQKLPDIVQTIARSKLRFKPGSKFEYSNSALFVLGRVIEVITGQSYAAYVQEKILNPLGMTDTYYAPPAAEPKRVAAIYARRDGNRETIFQFNPKLKIVNAAPDGGLFSYPAQILPFLQMFLNNGGRILSRGAVSEMLKEQAPKWGLGWSLEDGLIQHSGSSGTLAWADPKTRVIGILFTQYREQRDSDARLRNSFRQAVREAFAEPAAN